MLAEPESLAGLSFLLLDEKCLVEKKSYCLMLDRLMFANITSGVLTTGKVTCLSVSILIIFLVFGLVSAWRV